MSNITDKRSADMHFEQQVKEVLLRETINPILKQGFQEFFDMGMAEKVRQIKPNLETINANIDNANLSDADFRKFIGTVIPQLLDRIC